MTPDRVELERALHNLRANVEFPEPPDLSTAVGWRVGALDAAPKPTPPRRWRRGVIAVAGCLVAAVAVFGFSPRARSAAVDLFDIAGIDIRYGIFDDAPPLGQNLRLGTRVELSTARARVDLPVRVPRALGAPAGVYVRGKIVSLAYDDVLVTQFAADVGEDFAVKRLDSGTTTAHPEVTPGVAGYWFAGEPHQLLYTDDVTGEALVETLRLATNTLVWAEDGVTYRVEGDIPLVEALRIARSLR